MARSDGGRNWGMYVGASGSSQANIHWFLECFLLGTCSPHVLELPSNFSDFPSWLYYSAKCWSFATLLL
ncbi:hypothetical protein PRUPE_3G086300 [Prunus persica]|uniref:Uncharacterized protein n=1 Tax=Prunus persica TaxID=3760 RepID=A0A251PXC8_PRUPE|nr:hypothetical protein PRUPE_3G086300 [Prunus persica]